MRSAPRTLLCRPRRRGSVVHFRHHAPDQHHQPQPAVTADFNNDGFPDVASADCGDRCGNVPPGGIGSASVLLGNGTGGFSAAPGTPLLPPTGMEGPDVLATGDFDDNGRADLAVLYNLTNEEAI
jgi:hypothetical protein